MVAPARSGVLMYAAQVMQPAGQSDFGGVGFGNSAHAKLSSMHQHVLMLLSCDSMQTCKGNAMPRVLVFQASGYACIEIAVVVITQILLLPAIGHCSELYAYTFVVAWLHTPSCPAGEFQFDFEEQNLTEQNIRDYVWEEMCVYHP